MSQLRMICLRKTTSRVGTERFKREKPCLTGVAMTLRLAATGALARPNIILWIPTRLKAAQLFDMPLFEKVG